MGVVGWLLTAVETVFADVSASFSSGLITVNADGDAYGDCVSIYVDNDSVLVADFGASPNTTVMTDDASDVTGILVNGSNNGDSIRLDAVTAANGFSGISGLAITLIGGGGNDSIFGSGFADCIVGDQGNDELYGGVGNDVLIGGTGADGLDGESGFDTVYHGFVATGDDPDGSLDFLNDDGFDNIIANEDFGADGDIVF